MVRITRINLLIIWSFLTAVSIVHVQGQEWKISPKSTEIVIDEIRYYMAGGSVGKTERDRWYSYGRDSRENITEEQLYISMYKTAKEIYGDDYPSFSLRDFKWSVRDNLSGDEYRRLTSAYWPPQKTRVYVSCTANGVNIDELRLFKIYLMTATVVIPDYMIPLGNAVSKAFRNVNQGARLAIDQIDGFNEKEKEIFRDKLIDLLLDKGYRVVAKEYLQKLYEEQKQQKSEVYNNDTKVQENNFSAVGYYINVKMTETSIRVQVINVSTGEYEGNATINIQQQ